MNNRDKLAAIEFLVKTTDDLNAIREQILGLTHKANTREDYVTGNYRLDGDDIVRIDGGRIMTGKTIYAGYKNSPMHRANARALLRDAAIGA